MTKKVINSIPSVTEIVTAMQTVSPITAKNNRGTSYESIARSYLLRTVNQLTNAQQVDNKKLVYVHDIAQHINQRYNMGKKWYTWLRDNYPLYIMITQGNNMNGRATPSEVRSLVSDRELIEYRMNENFDSIYSIPTEDVIDISIDMKSLANFIMRTAMRYQTETDGVYKHKLRRNIAHACEVLDCAKANGGVLSCEYSRSPYGRIYMRGVNIQNTVSSEVREAALGKCYKYDIASASYAFRLGYIKENAPDIKTPALIDIVENKARNRKVLATQCLQDTNTTLEVKIGLIKKALNMIGFGAKTSSSFGAIKDIIWNDADRVRFVNHPLIVELKAELDQFTELLKEEIPKATAKRYLNNSTRYSQSKFESYVYQQMETVVMQTVMTQTKTNVIMWCHDAIYTDKCEGVGNLNYVLHQQPYWQYANFEEESITAWTNPTFLEQEVQHKAFIKAEEQRAEQVLVAE